LPVKIGQPHAIGELADLNSLNHCGPASNWRVQKDVVIGG
jgi:hypothetical protein